MDSDECIELIVSNWNKVVHKKDTVYILGDFTMERHQRIPEFLKRLNGNIKIIGGNHDDEKCVKILNELGIPVLGCLKYKGFICTHIPIHPDEVEFFRGNIHGHIHKDMCGNIRDLGVGYFNVNTELHNYTPVLFSEIEKTIMENKLKYYASFCTV